jgi:hypothetical protein
MQITNTSIASIDVSKIANYLFLALSILSIHIAHFIKSGVNGTKITSHALKLLHNIYILRVGHTQLAC